jgi:ABC-type arginine transport system ATPase subunit
MSWSTRLILVFISFGLFMSYMIYRCMKVPVNLVSKAYYKDELAYQDVIDAKKNTLQLSDEIVVQTNNDELKLVFPESQQKHLITSRVLLYSPQQLANDRLIAAVEIDNGQQLVPIQTMVPGRYIAKIEWSAGGKNYYAEKEIIIP